jgi:uncharacterized protein YyaL (SSP411 family)
LILRVKDDYDGAEPSGNSVATLALLKLAAITGRENFTAARRKNAATVRAPPAKFSAGRAAVHAARAGFLAGRTAPRRHRRQK